MVLLIDNYDSFTWMLCDYVMQAGSECIVIRNNERSLEEISKLHFTSAIISPGPKTPSESGITMSFIERYYSELPILGVCLGHQALGEFFGAKLIKAQRPMHGKTSVITCRPHPVFNNLPVEMEVMRYHSLILDKLEKTPLTVIASTSENEVMAIAHTLLPVVGVQFHPESVLTGHGLQMLNNWFHFIRS